MKNTRIRSFILILLIVCFFGGIGYFVYEFVLNARQWAMQPINKHLSEGRMQGGKIFDRNGVELARTENGKRVYNDKPEVRKAMLHIVGDGSVLIPTSVQSRYSTELFGYSMIAGFGAPQSVSVSKDITLTLDSSICSKALKAFGDRKGALLVYNYLTGEVIALASSPSYDPVNKPDLSKDNEGKYDGVYINRAFSASYTPGSIFKIVTTAAALEHMGDAKQRQFYCNKVKEVENGRIVCMSKHGNINLINSLSKSCDITFSDIAIELGRDKMIKKAEEMGFNKEQSVDGISLSVSRYDTDVKTEAELGWSGVGQHKNTVNPMHMLMIMGAIANEGVPTLPYMVKSISSDSMIPNELNNTKQGERMLSAEDAKSIREMMRYTMKNQYKDTMFPNMQMCAKTGTAEVGEGKEPHGWMVGFSDDKNFPMAFVVIVENSGFGIKTAGPVASTVMKDIKNTYKTKK